MEMGTANGFAASPRAHLVAVGVEEQQIEISRHVSEPSQEQGHLSPMMDAMVGRVLHQFSQRH
jgi:hypothetical protein